MNILFFGMGYSSSAVATAIRAADGEGVRIAGTVRQMDAVGALRDQNIEAHVFGGDAPSPTLGEPIERATHIVHSIAPDDSGDAVFTHHRDDLMNANNLGWMCYFSTVGVYGNQDGNWTDEGADCLPQNTRSQQRNRAENQWREFAEERGLPLLILRLAGIYGPGRSAFDKLNKGTAKRIVKKGQVFNRIHVEDIGRVTMLAAKKRLSGTFNLGDDKPAPPQDIVSFAADLLGVEPPPEVDFDKADMSDMARSFYNDNKRISNEAIKKELGIELLYPTYREGLRAIYLGAG